MKKILVNKDKCSGCKICESVCSYQKLGDKFNRRKAAIRVVIEGELGEKITPIVCRHCKKAKCAEVCPVDAFYEDQNTGALIIDKVKCIGCGLCAEECPFGAINLHDEFEIPFKCDLCGGDPLCIKYCVPNAIVYEEEHRIGASKRERSGN
ncbi:MAG: hypothetical protein JM58_04195 [Peptococcaceae bacterium BICA1-8]|nr:MAG: hypothetical protein JM58_04195 [Peptococcaceae bacterium BICA1-8]